MDKVDKIVSSDKEIIASGSFLSFDKNPSTLAIAHGDSKVHFDFLFEDGSLPKDQFMIKFQPRDANDGLKLTFVNFNNSIGTFNNDPIGVGKLDNRVLYCNFNIVDLGGKRKQIFYTFYLGGTNE